MISEFNPAKYFILGFEGLELPKDFVNLIKEFPPAGFIFLGNNYDNPEQFRLLVQRLNEISKGSYIYSTDQEPGRVQRFKNGFPLSLNPIEYAQNGKFSDFEVWCDRTASLLSDIGINLNLAPVVDLAEFGSESIVLKNRSFGAGFDQVNKFTEILINEHRKKDVLACAKHFPGLGQADIDPHEKTAASSEPLERLREYHWNSFRFAARQKIEFMMTTHLSNPNLDNKIATFSPEIVRMLKEEIRHSGLILSDDLLMGGAGSKENIDSIAIDCLTSGHNLLIISKDIDLQKQAIYAIKQHYENDDNFRMLVNKNEIAIESFKKKHFSSK